MTETPPRSVTIRDARPDEWAEVGDVVVAAYEDLGLADHTAYLAHIRQVEDRARSCRVLVAVEDGTDGPILGSVTYVPGPESPYAETEQAGEAGIRMLGVRPEAQRRGIGTALMAACIDLARAEGRERLVLVTTGVFKEAARIYLRFGFRRARARDFAASPEVRLRGYELDLRSDS